MSRVAGVFYTWGNIGVAVLVLVVVFFWESGLVYVMDVIIVRFWLLCYMVMHMIQ